MKKIRIKIGGLSEKDDSYNEHFIYKMLKRFYDVEISDNPEYLFYDVSFHDYLNYDCIRIFYTGENMHPNFNFCDYAIGSDYINFGDRYYRLPLYLITVFYNKDELARGIDTDFTKPEVFTKQDLSEKTSFCSFVYSNYLADETRNIFFKKLNNYKKVSSGGGYLNNVGGRVANKLEFELKHKFSVAFENSSNIGYVTERIVSSIAAKTIPIYWGNPQIGLEFNEARFINCHKYKTLDEVVECVKKIDNDDNLYLKIINQPPTVVNYNFNDVRLGFDNFVRQIIDQPIELARRRKINPMKALEMEKNEAMIIRKQERWNQVIKNLALIYKPFKKIKFIENLKYRYFRNKYFKIR